MPDKCQEAQVRKHITWSHDHMDFCFKKWVRLKTFTTSKKYVVYFTLYKQLRFYRNVMSYAYTHGHNSN